MTVSILHSLGRELTFLLTCGRRSLVPRTQTETDRQRDRESVLSLECGFIYWCCCLQHWVTGPLGHPDSCYHPQDTIQKIGTLVHHTGRQRQDRMSACWACLEQIGTYCSPGNLPTKQTLITLPFTQPKSHFYTSRIVDCASCKMFSVTNVMLGKNKHVAPT